MRPRRALVFGAGGVLGFAWTLGALTAVEELADFAVADTDLVVGTSAGSVSAALIGAGLSLDVIRRHHQGIPAPGDPQIDYDHEEGAAAVPPRPGWRPASPGLTLRALSRPGSVPLLVALSGLLPSGRGSLDAIHGLIDGVAHATGCGDRWPDAPRPWIVAADHRTGQRIVFGRTELRPSATRRTSALRTATLADAVRASCSIPGWYPPTVIDGVPYIDGGAVSNASVDLLRDVDIDEAYVLAPMASTDPDRPRTAVARLERRVRRGVTRRILADVCALRARGVRVVVLTPDAGDLQLIGVNMMDGRRRTAVLERAQRSAAAQLRRQLASPDRPGWSDSAGGVA
jgi:NTE family protein